jgi:hypothetical protein
LIEAGLTAEEAAEAYRLEWKRQIDAGLTPGMPAKLRQARVEKAAQHNSEVRAWARIWKEVLALLRGEAAASGRLTLGFDKVSGARVLERRSLSVIRKSWRAPALLLDATLPEPILLEPVLGHPVEVRATISAKWSIHGRVRQIVWAPVSASKLGIVKGRESDKRVIGHLLRLIRLRAALAGKELIAVVGQKALIKKLTAAGLPANVETGNFGGLAGLDRWREAAGLICIGRPVPSPNAMETAAGVISGFPAVVVSGKGHSRWYERRTGGIRLADGSGIAVDHDWHPDSMAEALRWQSCEANLIQAIGRLRALRREPSAPFFVDIISDVPLPVTVDEVVRWDQASPGRWAEMAEAGVLLDSPADIETAFPALAPSRKIARDLAAGLTLAQTSIENLLIGVRANVTAFEYKPAARRPPAKALVLPHGPADLKTWLEERLGPIEWVRTLGEPAETEIGSDEANPEPCGAESPSIDDPSSECEPVVSTAEQAAVCRPVASEEG